MNVAELFVNIGIKGTDQTVKGIGAIQKGVVALETGALMAKASVLALFYAVERATVGSAKFGAQLEVFSKAFDLDPKFVQNWRYAMNTVQVSGDQADAVLQGMSETIGQIQATGQVPPFFTELMRQMGKTDISEMKNIPEVLASIQEMLHKTGSDKNLLNEMFKGLHITPEVRQGLERLRKPLGDYRDPYALSKGQIEALANLDSQWQTFVRHVEKFSKEFAVKHGREMISTLEHALKAVEPLVTAMEKLWEHSSAFRAVLVGLALYLNPIATAIAGIIYLLGEWDKFEHFQESIFADKDEAKKRKDTFKGMGDFIKSKAGQDFFKKAVEMNNAPANIMPSVPIPVPSREGAPVKNNTVNMHIHGNPDKSTVDKMKHSMLEIFGQDVKVAYYSQPKGLSV